MALIAANGLSIASESFGPEGNPAVLLSTGFSVPGLMWPDSPRSGLATQGFRVIRFDNRDIGRSSKLDALGADDPLIPLDRGANTAKAIPGARFVAVPGMVHDFTEALSAVYLREIGGFISGVEAASRAP